MLGESREIAAQFTDAAALAHGAELSVTGWNIRPATIPLHEPKPKEPQLHARTASTRRPGTATQMARARPSAPFNE